MGCQPDRGPGFAKAMKAGAGYRDMKTGMKALLIAGATPDADFKSDMVVVLASHMTSLTEKADVVLPLAALYEKHGTIMNTYGMTKAVSQAQTASGDAKDGADIAAELSQILNAAKGFKLKDVAASIKKVKAGKLGAATFKPVAAETVPAVPVSASGFLLAMNEGLLSGSGVAKVMVVKQPTLQE
jgi:formate dehydrogenase major subunit